MSAPEEDDLEVDELVARLGDLTQKIKRDISEGGYPPCTVLLALNDVTILQLLECDDPVGSLRHFIADLLTQFASAIDMPDEEP